MVLEDRRFIKENLACHIVPLVMFNNYVKTEGDLISSLLFQCISKVSSECIGLAFLEAGRPSLMK